MTKTQGECKRIGVRREEQVDEAKEIGEGQNTKALVGHSKIFML